MRLVAIGIPAGHDGWIGIDPHDGHAAGRLVYLRPAYLWVWRACWWRRFAFLANWLSARRASRGIDPVLALRQGVGLRHAGRAWQVLRDFPGSQPADIDPNDAAPMGRAYESD
jgi:hypothetical protein